MKIRKNKVDIKPESVGDFMFNNSFYPKINLAGHIQSGFSEVGMSPTSLSKADGTPKEGFKEVMTGLANNLNNDLNAPDRLLKDAMTGNNDVDIHDVMTAMAKAEINVSVATQITSKVIQAYDKIMQISV